MRARRQTVVGHERRGRASPSSLRSAVLADASDALTAYRALIASAEALGLDPETVAEARRYEMALRLLARPLDPVSAARACEGSAVRRALARCRR